jgi:hypothetical protein
MSSLVRPKRSSLLPNTTKQSDCMKRNVLDLLFPAGTEEPAETLRPIVVAPFSSTDHEAVCASGIDHRQNPDY